MRYLGACYCLRLQLPWPQRTSSSTSPSVRAGARRNKAHVGKLLRKRQSFLSIVHVSSYSRIPCDTSSKKSHEAKKVAVIAREA